MLKKCLNLVLICAFVIVGAGLLLGCEDEVKVHRESETTTEQQSMEVTP